MIDINDITVRIGPKVLLEHASAHISDGQKVGLVGPNGCGKSTLFRVLKGELETEQGTVFFPRDYNVVFVEQEFLPDELTMPILAFILQKDRERAELLQRLQTASGEELAAIHERLNIIGAAAAEARAAEILHGLGFSHEDLTRPVSEFSGGWRMRLALAAALFRPSDILLLDEPTNHLDLEASLWLENHLEKYRGTLLIISHDRHILNLLCRYIIHFDGGRLVTYSGNYDTFQQTRARQKEVLQRQAARQEEKRRHLQSFVDRFRYKASKAKQAQSRIKMLEKLETITLMNDPAATVFDFPEPEDLPPPLLTIEDGSAGYGDKTVLRRLNIQIVDNDRIALLGANGNGKSTLAKVVSGRLPLQGGTMRYSGKLKVGYFAQHQAEELPLEQTACEFMSSLLPDKTEAQVRAHLARFGLNREKALTMIAKLSGGEKARLLFAAMTYNAPQLLILDEPTNHLDIDGREALIKALNEYGGSVILITHDLHLIELIADDLWLVKNGTCRPYDGDLEDYKKLLLEHDRPSSPKTSAKPVPASAEKDSRAEKKQLQSRLKKLEKELEQLNKEKEDLENQFQNLMSPSEIVRKQKELAVIAQKLEESESLWLELSEKLESIS